MPHFFRDSDGGLWTQGEWDAVREFGLKHGLVATYIDPDQEPDLVTDLEQSGIFYVAFGASPADPRYGHCIVMRHGQRVHDPSGNYWLAGAPWLYVLLANESMIHCENRTTESVPVIS